MSKGLRFTLACAVLLVASLGSIALREAIVRNWLPANQDLRQRVENGTVYPFVGIASVAAIGLALRPIIFRGP